MLRIALNDTLQLLKISTTYLALRLNLCYNKPRMAKTKKDTTATNKPANPLPDLNTFIDNVNKKDKHSGKKIHFAFVNRKRK
ncbi:MAG: hypothetical protein A2144_11430 [Chloroflexi bacterium RBG_16_50_9]|nr:MAG: hypothetical protein A2144_11430 [Chloroflexi bacterium RBG_16_50_9]